MGTEATGAEEIAANLDSAIESEESPTSETGDDNLEAADSPESKEEGKPKPKIKAIPYSRFKEVNDTKNSLQNDYESLKQDYEEKIASISKLTKMLDDAREDSDMLKEIKALRYDEKMLPHLEAIDRKIRGIEEEATETGDVDDKKVTDVQKLLQQQKNELTEQLNEQQLDILTQRGDAIADKWLEALPPEYTDQDKTIVAQLWANEVDWEKIQKDPSCLQEHLKETFQKSIDTFGTPRGGLVDPDNPDTYEIEQDETPAPSPEEELMAAIKGKNYGALKEVEKGGRKTIVPEISDDEFADDLAKAMRAARR